MTKKCKKCERDKAESKFYSYATWCKECYSRYAKERRERPRKKKVRVKMTLEEVTQLMAATEDPRMIHLWATIARTGLRPRQVLSKEVCSLSLSWVWRAFKKACAKAGLSPAYSLETLRRVRDE